MPKKSGCIAQSIEINLSLFNAPWPRGLIKSLILIEIALKKFT